MKRYYLFIPEFCDMEEHESGQFVIYSDVADLERRLSEAVWLLRTEPAHRKGYKWRIWDNKRNAFLAEEEK